MYFGVQQPRWWYRYSSFPVGSLWKTVGGGGTPQVHGAGGTQRRMSEPWSARTMPRGGPGSARESRPRAPPLASTPRSLHRPTAHALSRRPWELTVYPQFARHDRPLAGVALCPWKSGREGKISLTVESHDGRGISHAVCPAPRRRTFDSALSCSAFTGPRLPWRRKSRCGSMAAGAGGA